MPSSREYLSYIMEQLAPLEGITTRQMMGEYIIYYQGKIAAELCDDCLLVKPVPAALALLPDAPQEPPYPGAKPMLLVEEVEDGAFLRELLVAMEPELPAPKPKKTDGEKSYLRIRTTFQITVQVALKKPLTLNYSGSVAFR